MIYKTTKDLVAEQWEIHACNLISKNKRAWCDAGLFYLEWI